FERLLMVNCHHQTPAQVTCAHCQRSANTGLSAWFVSRPNVSVEVSRTSYKGFCCRQHPVMIFFARRRHELGSGSMILADIAATQQAGFATFFRDHAGTRRSLAKLRLPTASTPSKPGTNVRAASSKTSPSTRTARSFNLRFASELLGI